MNEEKVSELERKLEQENEEDESKNKKLAHKIEELKRKGEQENEEEERKNETLARKNERPDSKNLNWIENSVSSNDHRAPPGPSPR